MSVIRCETCDRNIDTDFDSNHVEDCKWEADGQPDEAKTATTPQRELCDLRGSRHD